MLPNGPTNPWSESNNPSLHRTQYGSGKVFSVLVNDLGWAMMSASDFCGVAAASLGGTRLNTTLNVGVRRVRWASTLVFRSSASPTSCVSLSGEEY